MLLSGKYMSIAAITGVSSLPVSKTPAQFGAWLRSQLDAAGFTERGGLSDFGRKSGVSVSNLSRIINDDRIPEIEVLRRIGRALGYSLGEMMVVAGVATEDELPVRPAADREAAPVKPKPLYDDPGLQRLWEIEELPETERIHAITLIEALRAKMPPHVDQHPRGNGKTETSRRNAG
jgi:transcriptional regulator with XRE-family HTH domain